MLVKQKSITHELNQLMHVSFLLFVGLFFFIHVNAQSNQWTWVAGDNTYNQAGVYGSTGVAASTNKPGARQNAATWTDASGNFWMFGGFGFDASATGGELNDLWKYNLSTGQWTWMGGTSSYNDAGTFGTKGLGSTANYPSGRDGSISWVDASSGNLWLYGGSGGPPRPTK
jgi:hypothetical protein